MWLAFGCIASLLPVGIQFLHAIDSPEGATFGRIFGDGELLVISAVIAAGALGEVILGMPGSILKLIFTFTCGSELLIASLWFGDLSGKIGVAQTVTVNGNTMVFIIKAGSVASASMVMFIATILTCGCALYATWRAEK
jgi:hypothetical protein